MSTSFVLLFAIPLRIEIFHLLFRVCLPDLLINNEAENEE